MLLFRQRSGVPEVFMRPQRVSCTLPSSAWTWPLVEGSGWATAPWPHLPITNALRLSGHNLTWLSHPHQVEATSATRPRPIQQVLWRLWPPSRSEPKREDYLKERAVNTPYNETGGFTDGSVVKNPPAIAGDTGNIASIPGSERSPGEGNGNLFQYSCQDNPMDRRAWQATVHGVTKSQTQPSDWAFTHNKLEDQWKAGGLERTGIES